MFMSLVGTTFRYTCSGSAGAMAMPMSWAKQGKRSTGSMSMKFMAQTQMKMVMASGAMSGLSNMEHLLHVVVDPVEDEFHEVLPRPGTPEVARRAVNST